MVPGEERPDHLVTSSPEPPAGAEAVTSSVRRAATRPDRPSSPLPVPGRIPPARSRPRCR